MEMVLEFLIPEWDRSRTTCHICNCTVQTSSYERHLVSNKHLTNELLKNDAQLPRFPDQNIEAADWEHLFPPQAVPQPFIPTNQPQRAPGGGRPGLSYASVTSRLLNNFYLQNHGRIFTGDMMQDLLNILRSDLIDKGDVPPTLHHLKKAGKTHIPPLVASFHI